MHTLDSSITVLEQDDCEDGSDDGNNQFYVRGLRQAYCIEEVSSQEQAKLVEPGYVILLYILVGNWLNLWVNNLVVVL